MSKSSMVKEAADAIHGVAKAVPIYQDILQPAAKELGRSLETAAKSVRLALAPVGAMVWGYDKIKDYVQTTVAAKLKNIPKERVGTPNPMVAGPALEALKYAGQNPTLRELYANLLATSIDSQTAHEAHPAFVEIVRQLTPDEARILKYVFERMYLPIITLRAKVPGRTSGFAYYEDFSDVAEKTGCQFPTLTPQYLGNICRLGLAEFHRNTYIDDKTMYEALEKHQAVAAIKKEIKKKFRVGTIVVKEYVGITGLGRQFCKACIVSKTIQAQNHP
jgi:hypothetical protein